MPLPPRWQWKLDRWRASLAGMFRSDPAERRPRLGRRCGTLVGVSASKCHECGASLNFSLAAASRSLSSLLPSTAPVTYLMLGVIGIFYLLTLMATIQSGAGGFMASDPRVLLRLGARHSYLILAEHEYWRLVMPIFLHGGLIHFLFNSMVLMNVGPQVEEVYGSARYLFLFVFTGVFSFVASTAWSVVAMGGGGLSIGASGSLMGIIGVMLALTYRRGGPMMQMLRTSLVRWIVIIFILGFFFRADHAAHAGGLAAGFLLGRFMADRDPQGPAERQRAYLLGWSSALVVAVSMVLMFIQYFRAA